MKPAPRLTANAGSRRNSFSAIGFRGRRTGLAARSSRRRTVRRDYRRRHGGERHRLLRAAFLLLPPGVETPALLRRALRYVPAAVLTAIWAPEVLVENERLLAGIVAIAVAWRWRTTFATIIAGLLTLHLFGFLR